MTGHSERGKSIGLSLLFLIALALIGGHQLGSW